MGKTSSQILTASILLLIVYFKQSSGELICWRCDPCPDPHSNTSTLVTAVTCTSSQTSCVKNTVRVMSQAVQISKGCVSSCTSSSASFFGQGFSIDCCNTNYCNSSIRSHLSLDMSKRHGDPDRGYRFWFYPNGCELVDTRWDTHNPSLYCNNHSYCRIADYNNGMVEFICQGHPTLWHGDPDRNHSIYVYPRNAQLANHWDTYNIQYLCNNFTFVNRSNGLDIYRCNGH